MALARPAVVGKKKVSERAREYKKNEKMIITRTNYGWSDRNSITDAATGSDPSPSDDLSLPRKQAYLGQ